MGSSDNSSSESDDDDCYGPSLPPHLLNKATAAGPVPPGPPAPIIPRIIGPTLPPSLSSATASGTKSNEIGPSAPAAAPESDDDDFTIGPYPPDDPRSLRLATAPLPSSKSTSTQPKREEWMLIPPKNKTISEVVGLTPTNRKFLGRTPDEIVKHDEDLNDEDMEADFHEIAKRELEAKYDREQDERMQQIMEAAGGAGGGKKKESESLLSLHRKKRKKDAEEEAMKASKKSKERRPFDRDSDLKVGGLSREDQEKFIKKTTELGSRFHKGNKKFL